MEIQFKNKVVCHFLDILFKVVHRGRKCSSTVAVAAAGRPTAVLKQL